MHALAYSLTERFSNSIWKSFNWSQSLDRQRVLLVEDDPLIRQTETDFLESFGAKVISTDTIKEGLRLAQHQSPDMAFLDLRLPDGDGLTLLREMQAAEITIPVVMISGLATIQDAVTAIQLGAIDFLVKPASIAQLESAYRRACQIASLKDENRRLRLLTKEPQSEFLGNSQAIRNLIATADRIAPSDLPILLEGATGTGKQVLAHHILDRSGRDGEPFVAMNCAAVVPTLFESEIFGHERGSFTGAQQRRTGKLELVGKGTLFLDEVGELPLQVQAKLLTAVEDRIYERVGGDRPLKFSGRIIAATNRDLEKEVEEGRFRRDLYYRLKGLRLKIPPLCERPEDIPIYIERAIIACRRRHGRDYAQPDESIIEELKKYPWPGNVRELQFHTERAALLSDSLVISRYQWLTGLSVNSPSSNVEAGKTDDLHQATEQFKQQHILRVLRECVDNQTAAAERLGIGRSHLNRILNVKIRGSIE